MPTVNITVKKSRLKIYNKEKPIPTYYLERESEFELEITNPTKDTILAKISINGKSISQAGLVLRPGEHVFLDRYFDVAKKFKFDVYEVANTAGAKKAIEDNGDIEVAFYNEEEPISYTDYTPSTITVWPPYYVPMQPFNPNPNPRWWPEIWYTNSTCGNDSVGTTMDRPSSFNNSNDNTAHHANYNAKDITNAGNSSTSTFSCSCNDHLGRVTLDECNDQIFTPEYISQKRSKSIETGRVEAGTNSNQIFKSVDKTFEWASFHIVRYKLLPISQRTNNVEDLKVRRYCVACGFKLKEGYQYCPKCSRKAE